MKTSQEVKLGYSCKTCAKWHKFDHYALAHSHVELVHRCDCGAEHVLLNNRARQTKPGKAPKL